MKKNDFCDRFLVSFFLFNAVFFTFHTCFVTIFALLRGKNTAKTSGEIILPGTFVPGYNMLSLRDLSFVSNKFETPFRT